MGEEARKKALPGARGFVLVLATFLVAGLGLGLLQERATYEAYELAAELPTPTAQPVRDRTWRPLELGEAVHGAGEGSGVLLKGLLLRRGSGGDIYVVDWREEGVKRFTPDGLETAGRFARSALAGGTFRPPLDVAPAADGTVWVIYSEAPFVHLFDREGELLREIDTGVAAQRITALPDGRFALLRLDGAPHLFEVRGPEGELLRKFGRLLDAERQSPLLLDGNLTTTEDGRLVYAPLYLDLLAAYTTDGELDFLVDTVDAEPGPLPKVRVDPDGWRKVAPGTPWQSLGINAEGGLLYVLSERDSGLEDRRIMDVYRSADGSYVESYRLPNNPNSAVMTSEWLYTVRRENLIGWPRLSPGGGEPTARAGGL